MHNYQLELTVTTVAIVFIKRFYKKKTIDYCEFHEDHESRPAVTTGTKSHYFRVATSQDDIAIRFVIENPPSRKLVGLIESECGVYGTNGDAFLLNFGLAGITISGCTSLSIHLEWTGCAGAGCCIVALPCFYI